MVFKHWTWARANTSRGTEVLYEVSAAMDRASALAVASMHGEVQNGHVPAATALTTRAVGHDAHVSSEAPPQADFKT